ncbi:NUDIX domain-containing protein [Mycobacterium paragordonae]|uniref:NUDIX domain-containing protein n=1 Tax=Mycobacterium paragordonae TaxID=1389713 RepID=UPI001F5B3BBB|nr:NUDIX domain-containing protein [Mycobacterium paragordonae]
MTQTWLSVDVIALTEDEPVPRLVLIRRAGTPHRGATTLPGGLLAAEHGETVEQAARRIVREKAGAEITSGVAIVDVVSDPLRDERGHTVSIVVAARVAAGTGGAVPVTDIPDGMPFQHTEIARAALARIGERLLTDASTTYALLGPETTFVQTCALLRACTSITDTAARARLDRSPLFTRTDQFHKHAGSGRPARVYHRQPA